MMPIHDQGYRRYGGGKEARGQGWLVIARAGIRMMVARRLFLALLLVSWVRFLYECIRVYLTTNFGQFSVLATTAQTFREFLEFQEIFLFFITIYVGAGLTRCRFTCPSRCRASSTLPARPRRWPSSCWASPGCRPCCC
jgi:hypothetical protein